MTKARKYDLPQGRALTPHDKNFLDNRQIMYDKLRSQAPHHSDKYYGTTFLTKFEDVRALLKHQEFSVDANYGAKESYMRKIAATGLDVRDGDIAYEPPLVLLDDPDHRRVRSLMNKSFALREIEKKRHRIEEITLSLLDSLRGKTEADLIKDFAGPLPTLVILDMMGITKVSADTFREWSEDILMGYDPERSLEVRKRLRNAYVLMSREFKVSLTKRRENRGNDLISEMVRVQEEEKQLNDLEIISLCVQLMVAGNVTTSDLIGNGLFALMRNPASMQQLLSNPALIESTVEEMLRFDCPISETARIAKKKTYLNRCPVTARTTMTASLSGANHDPEKFTDPHEFKIDRKNNDHLAFGSGIHICLGASLARLEAQVAVRELLNRYPDIRLNPEKTSARRIVPFFSGFTSLHVLLN